jgi:hypothetical protein
MFRHALTTTLPNSRTRAVWMLALFAAVQLADATMTLVGVARFGPSAEGNPILSAGIMTFGPGVTLVSAKAMALVLGTALHIRSHYITLTLLTIVYVFAALCPWTLALAGS